MKQSKDEQVLINFLNQLSKDDSPFSEEITLKFIEQRSTLPKNQFGSIKEVLEVKGIGEKTLSLLTELVDYEKDKVRLRSRTVFSFIGEAPSMEEYRGKVKFEPVPTDGKQGTKGGLQEYYLYYTSDLNKEQLFSRIKNKQNYQSSPNDPWFAIQIHDGKFLSVANDTLGFSDTIRADEAFRFDITGRAIIVNSTDRQLYPNNLTKIVAQRNNGQGGLFFDYGTKEVKYNPTQNYISAPNEPFYFDFFGIQSSNFNVYKGFTLMNFWKGTIGYPRPLQDGNGIDERRFITATGAGLLGHHYDSPGWLPENWYRYVDIVENTSLEIKHLSSQNQQWYVSTNQNGEVAMSSRGVGSPIPVTALFDMYVFYGRWEKRSQISARVVFRSKLNGQCLSVDVDNNITCNTPSHDWNETFLIEQGWGEELNNINLKTPHGKYLYGFLYQGNPVVKADSVTPLNYEQIKVVYP